MPYPVFLAWSPLWEKAAWKTIVWVYNFHSAALGRQTARKRLAGKVLRLWLPFFDLCINAAELTACLREAEEMCVLHV